MGLVGQPSRKGSTLTQIADLGLALPAKRWSFRLPNKVTPHLFLFVSSLAYATWSQMRHAS